jgi:hypothetical protein
MGFHAMIQKVDVCWRQGDTIWMIYRWRWAWVILFVVHQTWMTHLVWPTTPFFFEAAFVSPRLRLRTWRWHGEHGW